MELLQALPAYPGISNQDGHAFSTGPNLVPIPGYRPLEVPPGSIEPGLPDGLVQAHSA